MRLVVTFALDAEFAPWRRRRAFRQRAAGAQPLYEAVIDGVTVQAVLTGVGGLRAGAIAPVLARERPDACVVAGLGGGLSAALRQGALIVARDVVDAGAQRSCGSDPRLTAAAEACGAHAVPALVSVDRVLVRAGDKAAFAAMADVVDMETFSVFAATGRLRLPAVAVRAISDEAGEDLPLDFNRALAPDGRLRYGRLVGQVLSHPHRLGRLVRFGRASAQAADVLGEFLDR